MGKFKLPDFKIPDFRQKAEEKLKNVMSSSVPDFSSMASEKLGFIQKQMENPDIEKINGLIEKLSAAKQISHVANALGINISEEQIQKVIDKKNEIESELGNRAFSAVENFMEKEGYPIESSDKMLTNITNKMQSGDDPIDILKNTAKPFTGLISDTLNGTHSLSIDSVDLSSAKEKAKSIITDKATKYLTDDKIETQIQEASNSIPAITEKVQDINIPDINVESIENKIRSYGDTVKIDPNIPDNIKRLLDKYKITGGN